MAPHVLVTGSAGHLGEALMRVLPGMGFRASGLDILPSEFTTLVGDITDPHIVNMALQSADAVIHTATLHKPHVGTHPTSDFISTNISGTATLLDAAVTTGVRKFVFTSTTSAFGAALASRSGAPANWIDETVRPAPKNIYGVTKTSAEDLCELAHRRHGLLCIILRTSRFFPEEDDSSAVRARFSDENAKANEYLYRRVDLEDAAMAHVAALNTAERVGFGRYIISAPSPFVAADLPELARQPEAVVARLYPYYRDLYRSAGFRMFDRIDRVYDSRRACKDLGWRPLHDFATVLQQIAEGRPIGSTLARDVGSKGYHDDVFADGPYPVLDQ